MENKKGIWSHGTHRRATGAHPDTQMPVCLMIFSQCEENMQKPVKHAKMQNPRRYEHRGAGEMRVRCGEVRSVGGMRSAR